MAFTVRRQRTSDVTPNRAGRDNQKSCRCTRMRIKRIAGERWHSMSSCDPRAANGLDPQFEDGSLPPGDTLFCSMYAAYDALSAP